VPEILAVTLDLDDTLWPIWPTIDRAENVLHAWLNSHAPATARQFDAQALRRLRDEVFEQRPDWAHDLSRIRLESLRRALRLAGEEEALAETAFEVFFAERQRVDLFADVLPSLQRLARRYPIVAVTNGNADLERVGLADCFKGAVTAREFGVGKPDARIFHEACQRARTAPAQVLHVGDDLLLDVHGALQAGLRAAWVARPEIHPVMVQPPEGTHLVVRDLHELADRLDV
jgi:FMN hydrolase / 5-amino-6-(5-phospho-D-ribitylamino)uracil phosphatase